MSELCRKLRHVDISAALAALPCTVFTNTGGSNGHIARPEWMAPFVESLGLGTVVEQVVRLLPAYQGIPVHTDDARLSSTNRGKRYHIPLVTSTEVTMRWPDDNEEHHLEAGWLYEVDHTRSHEVVHLANTDRVHVVVTAL